MSITGSDKGYSEDMARKTEKKEGADKILTQGERSVVDFGKVIHPGDQREGARGGTVVGHGTKSRRRGKARSQLIATDAVFSVKHCTEGKADGHSGHMSVRTAGGTGFLINERGIKC